MTTHPPHSHPPCPPPDHHHHCCSTQRLSIALAPFSPASVSSWCYVSINMITPPPPSRWARLSFVISWPLLLVTTFEEPKKRKLDQSDTFRRSPAAFPAVSLSLSFCVSLFLSLCFPSLLANLLSSRAFVTKLSIASANQLSAGRRVGRGLAALGTGFYRVPSGSGLGRWIAHLASRSIQQNTC